MISGTDDENRSRCAIGGDVGGSMVRLDHRNQISRHAEKISAPRMRLANEYFDFWL